jgi:hypothetical protein
VKHSGTDTAIPSERIVAGVRYWSGGARSSRAGQVIVTTVVVIQTGSCD